MYNCYFCKRTVGPGEPMYRKVIKSRHRKYPYRRGVNKVTKMVRGSKKTFFRDDKGGEGWESAREVPCCYSCKQR